MIEILFALLLIPIALLAFGNWRYGFALCVLTALLQDAMRKLVPEQPVYFVILVGVVFGAAIIGAAMSGVSMAPRRLAGWQRSVGLPFAAYVLIVMLQAFHSFLTYGSLTISGIGVMSYLAPVPAVVLAYHFVLSRGDAGLRRWMKFYVMAATIALVSVYLEFSGLGWTVFGEVGGGVLISGAGEYYKGNSGTFRAAEIAAWHAATVACFAFMLFWGRRFSTSKVLVALAFIAFLIGIGALTGRRKMIVEISIFLSAYFCLVVWFRRRNGKLVLLLAMAGLLSYGAAVGMMSPDKGDASWASERVTKTTDKSFKKHTERASTVFSDVPRRVAELGFQSVGWAIAAHGWLGAGAGVGSQGVQHFGVERSGASEGGLGKVTMELGVPGLIIVVWLLWSFFRYSWRILVGLSASSVSGANLAYGLVAYIVANIAAFSIATQAYGDLYILLTLGWCFGFLIALPVLTARQLVANTGATVAPNPRAGPYGATALVVPRRH